MNYFKQHYLPFLFFLLLTVGCATLNRPKTAEQVKTILISEGTASLKYASYAKRARKEGFPKTATLLEALSRSLDIQAKSHSTLLKNLGGEMGNLTTEYSMTSTEENLKNAILTEANLIETLYPKGISVANDEKVVAATSSLSTALNIKRKQHKLLEDALKAVKEYNEDNLPTSYEVCPKCGNTFPNGQADSKCEYCQTSRSRFLKFK
jgi:rubrerythrin